ncbi:MAG TPA: dethiobiotin synthase [Bacteroidia bacterium]
MKQYFVTGIGTDIGKTVVSAVLCRRLNAAYYKPIQAGNLENLESDFIKNLVPGITIFETKYKLNNPLSPHLAAKLDNVRIDIENITLPNFKESLIVEGAGGILVPLNDEFTILDLIKKLKLPVIVIVKHYLGSINHSLLTCEVLKQSGVEIAGIIFNGESNEESEKIILKRTQIPCIGRIPELEKLNQEAIEEASKQLKI